LTLTELSLKSALIALPQGRDPQWAAEAARLLREHSADIENAELKAWVEAALGNQSLLELLGFVFSHSPFLTQCILRDLAFLRDMVDQGPDTCYMRIVARMKDEFARLRDQDQLMRDLRIARRRVALLTAVADISGHWPLDRVTHALSDFADGALSVAISHLLLEAAEASDIVLADPLFPEDQCGYVALAMGKHGGRELNYSSDIDLIVVYEPAMINYRGRRSHQQFAVRLTQRLITILQQSTPDGYVCRVDLNLRPDPGATPVAIGYAAAQTYYRNRGENWERAAMIKARPAAGDLGLGRQFMDELGPFIWREAMDFWMLQDMLAIKRRINAHKGSDEIAVAGQNVKLGRGGIREIEFYTQTQQLIYGGADPYLRCERTVEALTTLAEAGHIDDAVADELTEAYEFLRRLEHRLQMVDDRQTQTMPDNDDGVAHIAKFMGFDEVEDFESTLLDTLSQVVLYYERLFESATGDEADVAWSFDSETPNPRTSAHIEALGFSDTTETYRRLRHWHSGALRLSRDKRALELLQQRIPDFARSAARLPQPDAALEALESFLGRLPSGLRLLSMISAHPLLLGLLFEIVTLAPALAVELARRSERMQTAFSARFFDLLPDRRLLRAECADIIRKAGDAEDAIERMGVWANDHRFQVAINLLRQSIDAHDAGLTLSDLADAVVEQIGTFLGGDTQEGSMPPFDRIAIVATGAWGRRDLALATRADLLFVYQDDEWEAAAWSKLARRTVAYCTARISGGKLCDMETDRGIWGAPGPMVTPLESFIGYFRGSPSAEQIIALTELRMICGPPEVRSRLECCVQDILSSGDRSDTLVRHANNGIAALGEIGDAAILSGLSQCTEIRMTLDGTVRALQLKYGPETPDLLTRSVQKAIAALTRHELVDNEILCRLSDIRNQLRQVEAMISVRFGRIEESSCLPAEPDADLLRAAGMIATEEWRGVLAEGIALLCAIRDGHLQ
jgi:glutamate-ammonia-ligase adenylyltransferase